MKEDTQDGTHMRILTNLLHTRCVTLRNHLLEHRYTRSG